MATTTYGVNNPLAVKLWANELFHEAIKQTWFGRFFGTDSNSLIQVETNTEKGAGDRVRVGLRSLLTGSGIQGDGTLEGNEESLVTYYQDTLIDQLRHAVRSGGKMSEQRILFNMRQEAKMALSDWWAERIEKWCANQLTGNTSQTDTRYTGNNAVIAATSIVLPTSNDATEASLSTSTQDQFNLGQIDRAIVKARTGLNFTQPRIRPLKINGDEFYVLFMHPNQVYQMRTSTNTGQWLDIQKAAMAGIDAKTSPVFTGALGIYNQTIIHECPYLPSFTIGNSGTNNAYRAVFCGAQAAVMAYGQDSSGGTMSWNEKEFDYGNQLGVEAGMIAGLQKTYYNSLDFATIVLDSYSPAP